MTDTTRKDRLLAMLVDDPDDAFLRYGLAMEYVSSGEDQAALECFTELSRRSPDYVPAYLQAGQLLSRLGKTADARFTFQRGIAVAERTGDRHAAGEMTGFLETLE